MLISINNTTKHTYATNESEVYNVMLWLSVHVYCKQCRQVHFSKYVWKVLISITDLIYGYMTPVSRVHSYTPGAVHATAISTSDLLDKRSGNVLITTHSLTQLSWILHHTEGPHHGRETGDIQFPTSANSGRGKLDQVD